MEIKVVAWDGDAHPPGTERWLDVPASLDPGNVEDFVISRFGEPSDVALRVAGPLGEIVRGWVYPAHVDILQLAEVAGPPSGGQLLLVPFVRFDDGTRRELFTYASELNHAFADAIAPLGPIEVDLEQLPPSDSRNQLAAERAWLASKDPESIELQVAGWLRRMVAEGWTYLILEIPATGRYVQFLIHDGDWLRGEAVGDRYLVDHAALRATEHARLVNVGWNQPLTDSDTSGNYWFEWIADISSSSADLPGRLGEDEVRQAAAFAARTLVEAFGPVRLHGIEVHTGPASIVDF